MKLFTTRVSFAASRKSKRLTEGLLSRELFEKPALCNSAPDQKDGKAILTALYSGRSRGDGNKPIANTALSYDFDDARQVASFKAALETFELDGVEHVAHTTVSHNPLEERWRLYLPLTRNVTPTEYRLLSRAVAKHYGMVCDATSHVSAQLMFAPMVYPGQAPEYEHIIAEGGAINPDGFDLDLDLLEGDDSELDIGKAPCPVPAGIQHDQWVSAVLGAHPPGELDYHAWFDTMAAVHHQFGGSPAGYKLFDAWSYDNGHNPKYDFSEAHRIRRKWRSLSARSDAVTLRKIVNLKDDQGVTVLAKAYCNLIKGVTENDKPMLDTIRKAISSDSFCNSAPDRKLVAKTYLKHCRKLDIATDKATLKTLSDELTTGVDPVDVDLSEMLYERYCFLAWNDMVVYDLVRGENVKVGSFNRLYKSEMPIKNFKTGTRYRPTEAMEDEIGGLKNLRMAMGERYQVNADRMIQDVDTGEWYVNQYQQGTWPIVEEPFDPASEVDSQVERMVTTHLSLLAWGDAAMCKALCQWLAHTRQRPHTRASWGISLLSTTEGLGKSFYGRLCATVLGGTRDSQGRPAPGGGQVATMKPHDLESRFNTFASAPRLITFVEEPEVDGSKREVKYNMAGLKQVMSEDVVSVERKGIDTAQSPVHTQFGVFGNDIRAMGDQIDGRRWAVSVIPRMTPEKIAKFLGTDTVAEFYTAYANFMRDHQSRFAAYFESIDISDMDMWSAPQVDSKFKFRASSPAEIAISMISEIVAENTHLDIGPDIVYFTRLKKHILHEANNNPDDPMLRPFSSRNVTGNNTSETTKIGHIEQALSNAGYEKLTHDRHTLQRMKFSSGSKLKSDLIWMRSDTLAKANESGFRYDMTRMRRVINKVLEERLVEVFNGVLSDPMEEL